ncbi:MAG: ABC transporter ATP-binding protein [Bradymonadia bacterium]
MNQLILDGLSKSFRVNGRTHQAVHPFECSLDAGKIVAIVGESGSGKSTIARMVVGLETPDTGGVTVSDGSTSRRPKLTDVQMVFQDPFASLNPVHTVHTHLARTIRRLRTDIIGTKSISHEVQRLLEVVELKPVDDYIDRYPGSLSGGQRQRVAIARALAPKPAFIVADEPTSMLDVSIRKDILNLLSQLKAENVGIMLITHDLLSVKSIADRVYVLKDGVCVESGPTEQVLSKPSHPYTQTLCAAVPDPDGHFLRDEGENSNQHQEQTRSTLNV